MSTTITPISATYPTTAAPSMNIPSPSSVFTSLLRSDLRTQWRNRRASFLVVLLPLIILVSWKGLVDKLGGAFVLSNCITIGLTAIGLMGYSNSIARDRDKGIFQRLRVAPVPSWAIMASRIAVQLIMIMILTTLVFIFGYQIDHISLSAAGYLFGFAMAIVGGAVYLALGQVIVGRIQNPETVNATSRLVYIAFIMIGMFGELGMLGKEIGELVKYSPYGTVKRIVSAGLVPGTWNEQTSMSLLITLGYTIVFAYLGIKWFRWSSR
ncbi:MAG TPA: ABC transporter permease [Puia sp.]|nr:ABC transporter permease [Puia sp.]